MYKILPIIKKLRGAVAAKYFYHSSQNIALLDAKFRQESDDATISPGIEIKKHTSNCCPRITCSRLKLFCITYFTCERTVDLWPDFTLPV